jgi:hypothetical protein
MATPPTAAGDPRRRRRLANFSLPIDDDASCKTTHTSVSTYE